MSLERTSPLKPINAVQAREKNEAFATKSRPAKSSSPNSASVTLSDAQARLMQPGSGDINQDRVDALKTAISNGELKVNLGKIAEAIISEARRLLLDKKGMSRLSEILDRMVSVLNALTDVMDAEQQQLSAGQINGSALQHITETKSSLLATLDYLEQQRRAEAHVKRSQAENDALAARGQAIDETTLRLRDVNEHNGWLLEGQIELNQRALAVLRPHQEPGIYGADGQKNRRNAAAKKSPFSACFGFLSEPFFYSASVNRNCNAGDRHARPGHRVCSLIALGWLRNEIHKKNSLATSGSEPLYRQKLQRSAGKIAQSEPEQRQHREIYARSHHNHRS